MQQIARFLGAIGQGCLWFALSGFLVLQIPAIIWQFETNGVLVGLAVMASWPVTGTWTIFHMMSIGAFDGLIAAALWWIAGLAGAGVAFIGLAVLVYGEER